MTSSAQTTNQYTSNKVPKITKLAVSGLMTTPFPPEGPGSLTPLSPITDNESALTGN